MNLIPFNFNGADVRVITDGQGEPWFVAKDVADLLEYTNPQKAVRDHCKGATPVGVNDSFGLDPQTNLIPERDVYRLIMRSKMPAAEAFEEWVVGDVLPTIRKTGSYQKPMTQAEMIAASANILVDLERQQAEHQVALNRVERRVEDLSQTSVWDHCPQNCQSLTRVKETMLKRHGLSGAVVDYVLRVWPNQPNPAGMVRNGHEEALGSQYLVWSKHHVTAAFHRFVSESTMVTTTQATHPYFEGRFRLVQKVSQ